MSQQEDSTIFRDEVFRLLLSSGYFRVRMPDLDDFDKVAGGLAWALKSSSVDVDVDIFFKEKPNIGEKIRISESICTGLVKSKCPFPLAPYQIQGLDFPKLFPIIQWLVKLVIATRNEFGDFQRSYAEFSFNNKYANLPSDVLIQEHSHASRSNIGEVERFFPPKRMYKRSDWDTQQSELKEIETTLLEYGRVPMLITAGSRPAPQNVRAGAKPSANSAFAQATAAVSGKLGGKQPKQEGPTEEELKQIEENHQKEMKNTIRSMVRTEGDERVNFDAFSDLMNDEDILRQRELKEREIRNAIPESKITEEQLRGPHEAKMAVILEQIEMNKLEYTKLKQRYDEIHAKFEEISGQHDEALRLNKQLKKQIKKCNQIIEDSAHTDDLLRAISVRDDTMSNLELFTEQCQTEMREWNEKIQKLKELQSNDDSDNSDVIQNTLDSLEKEWDRIKALLAEKARVLLEYETNFDQIPTSAELAQYDRRLTELDLLSTQKDAEQKKCKHLLASLVESQEVLQNENDLFNTILKTFSNSEKDSKGQKALLEKMDTSQKETSVKKKAVGEELKRKRDVLATKDEQYRKLQETQRKYFQAIKEFQSACEELDNLRDDDEDY